MVTNGEGQLERLLAGDRLVLDNIPIFVFYKDTKNQILAVNKAVSDSLGVEPAEMANTPSERWFPDLAAQYYEDDLTVIRSGRPKTGIVETIATGDGEQRSVETDKFPLKDDSGQVVGIVVIARDVTERVRLEEELRESQQLESIGRLAGGIAHDFNNLLTAMLGHTTLADRHLGEPVVARESLDAVRLAIQRASDLTNQLLAFARRQVHQPQVVDLNEVVEGATRMLRRVIGENIDVSLSVEVSPLPTMADPGQLSQVIVNLLINARDAMPNGGQLTVTTTLSDVEATPTSVLAAGRYVEFNIVDTGEGISPENVDRVFEPFFTTKKESEGTGLGLATVYGIVRQNGGDIQVESEVGRGTTFTVRLPLSDGPIARGLVPAGRTEDPAPSAKILFVEDDSMLRRLGTAVLSQAGYDVISAPDGEQALDLAVESNHLDLLVTDVLMPGMNGSELAERLTTLRPGLPVLFVSGFTEDLLISDGRLTEGVELLAKPYTPDALLERVARELAKR